MKIPGLKLKNKLAFFNALSKAAIVTLLLFTVPWMVGEITLRNTDNALLQKLDKVLKMIDTVGIEQYIDHDAELKAFGSYNILKEEFIAIEQLEKDTFIDVIQYSQRVIEGEIVDYRVLSYTKKYNNENYLIEIGKSMADIYRFQQNLKRFAFIFLTIILFITFIVDISFIQYLLRPLDKIINKLQRTDHPANFDYTAITTKTADFIYLDETIRSLMNKIEMAFNNEREYISNVSHELLTPISIIRTKLDNIMHNNTLSEPDIKKIVESKKTLQRLTKLVRTLLTMSRIENEEYLLNDKIKINTLVEQVINEIEDKITLKNLALELKTEEFDKEIVGNKELLFTMLFNIINNAIRYTDNGLIKIQTELSGEQFSLIISDTGKGMPKEQLKHIFSRFKSFEKNNDSFGLGLALTKKIADYHKIDINVTSKQGKGTSFFLAFP